MLFFVLQRGFYSYCKNEVFYDCTLCKQILLLLYTKLLLSGIHADRSIHFFTCWNTFPLVHYHMDIPALLILCVTAIRLQYSVKSLEVYWFPWSLCKISTPLISDWDFIALRNVRIASSDVIFRSVMLATTLLSCRSIIVQLYLLLPSDRYR